MVEVLNRKIRAGQREHIDVAPRCADHAEQFLDTQVRIGAAVTFETREPLELNRGFDFVIHQNRSSSIVNSSVDSEDELGHEGDP